MSEIALAPELTELHPDRWTEPFWSAAARHELIVARCSSCPAARMPPGARCPACGGLDLHWVPASGAATVHAFTVARQAFAPTLAAAVPYVLAVVQLTDHPDVRLISNVMECAPETVRIGLPVRVAWDGVIPRFVPTTEEDDS
jgi:uncharacterized OB-fold protein